MSIHSQMGLESQLLGALPPRLVRPVCRRLAFRRLGISVESDFGELLQNSNEHEGGLVVRELCGKTDSVSDALMRQVQREN